eukprot:3377969-Amphidinium_carterae.1
MKSKYKLNMIQALQEFRNVNMEVANGNQHNNVAASSRHPQHASAAETLKLHSHPCASVATLTTTPVHNVLTGELI